MYFVMKIEGHESFEHIHHAPRRTLYSKRVIHVRQKEEKNIKYSYLRQVRVIANPGVHSLSGDDFDRKGNQDSRGEQTIADWRHSSPWNVHWFEQRMSRSHEIHQFTIRNSSFSIIRHREKPTRNYDRESRSMRALLHSNFDRSKTRNWDCFQESAT